MAKAATPSPSGLSRTESEEMNTLPDPRTPSPGFVTPRHGSTGSDQHPDLSNEVAMLSTKLINAINHQTNLDDSLQRARHELEAARERISQLEAEAKQHVESVRLGLLLRRDNVLKREAELSNALADERSRREIADKEKKKIEQELENLTSALFEEANTMVAAARKETEASERRNEQLRSQLRDNELLLASQQEQLQDLKAVMHQMSSDRDENETSTHISTAPSTPLAATHDKMGRLFDSAHLTPGVNGADDVMPDHPLHFSHLIRPALRTDLDGYEEFQALLKMARPASSQSRVSSGNYSGLNILGLNSSTNSSQPSLAHAPANGSSSSIPGAFTSSPSAPSSINTSSPSTYAPSLKDCKFYKRVLAEDIEPTLRLDVAPGLSWLARRTILSSIASGTLIVEPQPSSNKFYGPIFACALCGENRKGELYARRHRFRTSESDDAQRYPLCEYCLGRLRATCDFLGFLRMVKEGLWRAETEEEGKCAWEESVRLRERMFWARIGGGVVPALGRDGTKSPMVAVEKGPERNSEDSDVVVKGQATGPDPFQTNLDGPKRVSIGKKVLSRPGEDVAVPAGQTVKVDMDVEEAEERLAEEAAEQLRNEARHSTGSTISDPATVVEAKMQQTPEAESPPRTRGRQRSLSLTIPGAFE